MIEGNFQGKAVKAEIGTNKDNKPVIRAQLEITEGEHKGKRFNYEGNLKPESIKYTKRDMVALGWQGKDVMTFVDDVMKAAKVVPFDVTIATWSKPDGTVKQWESVRSIGYSAPPLNAMDKTKAADVNSWFAEAGDVEGQKNDDRIPF
jgi:hypothetical protein